VNDISVGIVPPLAETLMQAGALRFLIVALLFPGLEQTVSIGTRLLMVASLCSIGSMSASKQIVPVTDWLSVAIVEVILGCALILPIYLVYHGIRTWSDLFESLRGSQTSLLIDPLSGGEEPTLAIVLSYGLLTTMLYVGFLPALFTAASYSLDSYPPLVTPLTAITLKIPNVLHGIVEVLTVVMVALVPCIVVVLMIECGAAVISQIAQHLSVATELYVVRLLLLIGGLLFGLPELFSVFMKHTRLSVL
jgi:type III secretory pathway component EscT